MTVTGVRHVGSGVSGSLGYSVSSSGPYVLATHSSAAGTIWLWKRNEAGVLEEMLTDWAPSTPHSGFPWFISNACWYNEAEARLEIVIGRPNDGNPTRKCGSVLFMDWPDSGTTGSDMIELQRISADLGDQFDPQSIGQGTAICRGRCIALGASQYYNALFLSRTGDTWSIDKLDTTTYNTWWNFDVPRVQLTEHPDDPNAVLGEIPCAYYGSYGAIFVVKSASIGNWSDPARLDGNEGGGTWATGRTGAIGPGANGNITIAGDWGQNPEGAALWNRDPTDPTDATWLYQGHVKFEGRVRPEGLVVGYNLVAGGYNSSYSGVSRVGPINVSIFDGRVAGKWDVAEADGGPPFFGGEYADVFVGPGWHNLEDSIWQAQGMSVSYMGAGIVRIQAGAVGYRPNYPDPPVLAGITEYNGDLDWPSPPDPQPVDTDLTVNQIVVVAKDIIGVRFTEPVTVTSSLLDPTSYTISGGVSVAEVLPSDSGRTTSIIYLRLVPKATYQSDYVLTIPSIGEITEYEVGFEFPAGTIYTPYGVPIATITVPWLHHRTKTDAVLASLPGMYNKVIGGNIRSILQAITMSDEEIGGDF